MPLGFSLLLNMVIAIIAGLIFITLLTAGVIPMLYSPHKMQLTGLMHSSGLGSFACFIGLRQ